LLFLIVIVSSLLQTSTSYMYQMYTYLMHQPTEMNVRGVLIYPFNGVEVDEVYRWDERMTMEVMTLNLDDCWKEICGKLMGVLGKSI
jgi:5-methylcytosine-specific restriction enzyme subunit McrC